jgi:ribosomal protein S18 acetylase RimI-like enzyme
MAPRIVPFDRLHVDGVVGLCAAQGWSSWNPENTAQGLSAPGVIAVVAEEAGEVLGVAELLTDGHVMAYLALLVVAEHVRGRGIGSALIEELFVRSGLERMDLLSEQASVAFYESMPHKSKPGYRIYKSESSLG